MLMQQFPDLGFGLGLRVTHYPYIFEHWPKVDWFEIISENFMDTDGRPRRNLEKVREHYPIVMHGISMSIGTVDPLDSLYLKQLKALINAVKPAWVSDHLCWTGIAHRNSHDLLPVPYTEEALDHIVERIGKVQEYLGRTIALENPSTYLEFKSSHIPEAEFIREMAKRSGCHLLLDVNNVYVSCYNHRLDPKAYLDTLPLEQVIQIHLSGHTNHGTHIIDTHDDHVVEEVWALYRYVSKKAGRALNTMVEWDGNIPEFPVLFAELEKAKQAARAADAGELPRLDTGEHRHVANDRPRMGEEQARMLDAILQGDKGSAQEWIREKQAFPAGDQLQVYINSYRYRLYDVVAEDFPVLEYHLGSSDLETLIHALIEQVPSRYFNIGRYTNELPMFLAQHRPDDKAALEIAVLENALSQLADAEETAALVPEDLAGLTPEALMEMTLRPRSALALFAFEHAVNQFYTDVKEEKAPHPPEPKKEWIAVFRHEDRMWRMPLSEHEYHLLSKIFTGTTVGQALSELPAELGIAEDALAPHLSEWFARWIRNGLLARTTAKIRLAS